MPIDISGLGHVLAGLRDADRPERFADTSATVLGGLFHASRAVVSLRDALPGSHHGPGARFVNWPAWCGPYYQSHLRDQDPIRRWLDATPAEPVTRLSDLVPDAELIHAPYFETMLRPCGSRHVLTLAIRDHCHIAGALSLVRDAGDQDFSGDDRAIAAALAPALDMAYRLACATTPRAITAPSPPSPPAPDLLTTREGEIARLVAAGRSNKDIARACGISPWTVKNHLRAIFDKTGLDNRTALCAWMLNRSC